MMTNEKRKEVARKLRKLASQKEVNKMEVKQVIGLYMGNCTKGYSPRSVNALADLIEPEPMPKRKAKAKPFPVEEDTGYFDTTKCECGYLNDVSATYCGQCGCVIEVV